MRFISNERGISLIEVVASLVIITIIFLAFFNFFIQSKKTNVSSEGIHDATYIAQVEMEEIYILSTMTNSKINLSLMGFSETNSDPSCIKNNIIELSVPSEIYSQTTTSGAFTITTKIAFLCGYENVGNVTVEVSDTVAKRATMENVYIWK